MIEILIGLAVLLGLQLLFLITGFIINLVTFKSGSNTWKGFAFWLFILTIILVSWLIGSAILGEI